MRIFAVGMLLVMLLSSPCFALLAEFEPGYQIATLVFHSDLIVVGRVTGVDFAFREGVGSSFNTDITIAVESLIKGETNAGANTVKFMVDGGTGLHPGTGEEYVITVEHSPDFEIGERVLVFLKKATRPGHNYPYGGYYVFRGGIGKRKVLSGDKFSMPYTFEIDAVINGRMTSRKVKKFIDLPVDLVVELGKASVKDFEAAKLLEADIKAVIDATPLGAKPVLNQEAVDELKRESKKIYDKEPEPEKESDK